MNPTHIFRVARNFSSRTFPPALVPNLITHRTMATAMSKRLEGKTILITGASSGIGKSTAQEFARTAPKNLKLILTARRIDTLKSLAEEITKESGSGVQVLPVQLDVSKASEVRSFVQNLPKEYQQIDVLVNNAGLVKGVDKVGDIKEEDLDVMMSTNVTGLINMTQAVLPAMKSRGEAGAGDIINVGSIAGREPYVGGSIYCATKAAVRSFTESMRKELIATRIRIIEIDPGQVETEFSVVRFGGDKAKADAVYKGCEPLTPDDIAEVVVFTAGRRENVVVADTLIFPNHQVRRSRCGLRVAGADAVNRLRRRLCIRSLRASSDVWLGCCYYYAQEDDWRFETVDTMTYTSALHDNQRSGLDFCAYFARIDQKKCATSRDQAAACQSSFSPRYPHEPAPPR